MDTDPQTTVARARAEVLALLDCNELLPFARAHELPYDALRRFARGSHHEMSYSRTCALLEALEAWEG